MTVSLFVRNTFVTGKGELCAHTRIIEKPSNSVSNGYINIGNRLYQHTYRT